MEGGKVNQDKKNVLLIIGNGFDLACGLKSKYSDFFNACIKDKVKDFDASIPNDFWQRLMNEYYLQDKHADYNWCNIEEIIKNTLSSLFERDSATKKLAIFAKALSYAVSNRDLKNIKEKDAFKKYMLKHFTKILLINRRYWLIKKNSKFLKQTLRNHVLFNLKILEKQFCAYLKERITKDKTYTVGATNLLESLLCLTKETFIQARQAGVNADNVSDMLDYIGELSVLSFNYTLNPFRDTVYDDYIEYSNVHGSLCDKDCSQCQNSSAIFGIDDTVIKDDNASDLHIFSKTYRTLQMTGGGRNAKILPTKDKPLVIKFFGHSLSNADYSYFQSIFDYYNIYDNSDVSLEFLYLDYDKENPNKVRNEKTADAYRLINDYGKTLNNKEQGKNLMHKLILEKRISVIEIEKP